MIFNKILIIVAFLKIKITDLENYCEKFNENYKSLQNRRIMKQRIEMLIINKFFLHNSTIIKSLFLRKILLKNWYYIDKKLYL